MSEASRERIPRALGVLLYAASSERHGDTDGPIMEHFCRCQSPPEFHRSGISLLARSAMRLVVSRSKCLLSDKIKQHTDSGN